MPLVYLKSTYGYGRPRRRYGPGLVDVPEGLVRALGLAVVGGSTPPTDPYADWPELKEGGFDTPEKVKAAADSDLLALKGIGPATLKKIRAVA